MNQRRFDALARSLARNLPRRGLLRAAVTASASLGFSRLTGQNAAAQDAASVELPCVPCNCQGDACECCLSGITGGGVVRTDGGDVSLVLFATVLAEDAPQEATGFVRWLDTNAEGGLTLESVGPISYGWPEGEEHLRFVHGVMAINGENQQPFVLELFDAGPGKSGEDTAKLTVGDATTDSESSGFGYASGGNLVGGDLQLLDTVAPVASPA